MNTVGGFLRAHRRPLLRLAGASVLEAVPAYLTGLCVARAVDHGFLAGRLGVGLAWLGLLAAGAFVGAYGTRRAYPPLADIVEPFRDLLVERVVRGALHRSTRPGARPDTAAVARLSEQVEVVREAFGGLLMLSRGVLFTVAGAVAGVASLVPATLPLIVAPVLAGGLAYGFGLCRVARRERALLLADEQVADVADTLLSGRRDVLACGAEAVAIGQLDDRVRARAAAARAAAAALAGCDLPLLLGGLLPVVLVLAAADRLTAAGASLGALLGTLTYLVQTLLPVTETITRGIGGRVVQLRVTLSRIAETDPAAPETPPAAVPHATGTVLARGLTFAYGPAAQPVIDRLDLALADGDHLAVVGPSGIGKSTLAALLAGQLDPTAGTVLVSGTPAARLPVDCRVLIPQQAYVFGGTLRDNLGYHLRAPLDDDRLAAAVHAFALRDLLAAVGGADVALDPAALSAGQRQLVALARAWLSPARLAILDEATCHLDPRAEARAERAFAERPGTLVVVAHRISSARRAARILVLDGTRATLGTHDTLLATAPLYRELVAGWSADAAPATTSR